VCLVLSLSILSGLHLIHRYAINTRLQFLTKNKNVAGQLTARIEEMKRLQGDQDRLNQQRSALAAIRLKNPPVSQVISKLSAIMNDETWLSQLVIDPGEENDKEIRLILIGFSMSNEHLGDFLNRLSLERSFKTVVLKYASESEGCEPGQKPSSGRSRIRFQIICQMGRG
jgi:Tfp pilus assembly protein PilN